MKEKPLPVPRHPLSPSRRRCRRVASSFVCRSPLVPSPQFALAHVARPRGVHVAVVVAVRAVRRSGRPVPPLAAARGPHMSRRCWRRRRPPPPPLFCPFVSRASSAVRACVPPLRSQSSSPLPSLSSRTRWTRPAPCGSRRQCVCRRRACRRASYSCSYHYSRAVPVSVCCSSAGHVVRPAPCPPPPRRSGGRRRRPGGKVRRSRVGRPPPCVSALRVGFSLVLPRQRSHPAARASVGALASSLPPLRVRSCPCVSPPLCVVSRSVASATALVVPSTPAAPLTPSPPPHSSFARCARLVRLF